MLGVLFLVIGVAYLAMGWKLGVAGAPVAWMGLACVYVAGAYLVNRPALLGKRADGARHRAAVLLWPYLGSVWVAWWLRRWVAETCWHEIAPGLFLGRRPRLNELPASTAMIVDLAAELPPSTRAGVAYRGLPTLDGGAPDDATFVALVREISAFTGGVYIHCAAGRGRSATVLAAVLIDKGLATGLEDAVAVMRQQRKRVHLTGVQRQLIQRTFPAR